LEQLNQVVQVTTVYQMALVAVSLVLAVFTFLLPKPDNRRKQMSSTFFRLFLAFVCLAYYAFTLRLDGSMTTSIVANNILLLVSGYTLMLTIYHRYELEIPKFTYLLIVVHTSFLVAGQLYLYGLEVKGYLRDVFLYVNLAIPILITLWHLHYQFRIRKMREKIIIVAVLLMMLVLSLSLYLYSQYENDHEFVAFTIYFLSSLMIVTLAFLGFALSITFSLVGKLRQQIVTDRLTGAKNRNYFYDVAEKTLAKASRHEAPASLILCDIDYFKAINDGYGHLAGDEVLKAFTQLLQLELRVEDSLVRIGGEEFIVLCPDIGLEGARLLAERLRKKVEHMTIEYEGNKLRISASFGATNLNPDLSIDKNVHNADKALYASKEQGRNRVNVFRS
jgi:diguanylate cyclase (GGDEF)-like protein